MNEMPQIDISFEEFKRLVFDSIKQAGSSFEFKNFCNLVGANAVKKEIVKNPNPPGYQRFSFPLQKKDEDKVREILWILIIERVVTIGNFSGDTWPWLSLTEYGEKAINSLEPVPNDYTGYLQRLKSEIPQIDTVIETYLAESIKTFNINQLLSSTITLGCASEKALIILIDSFTQSFKDDTKKIAFSKKVENRFIKTQFDEFDKSIKQIIPQFPNELKENYNRVLTGMFDWIRTNRNDAGHPTGQKIDKDILFIHLQVFIRYCKYIYQLKDYLDQHKHD